MIPCSRACLYKSKRARASWYQAGREALSAGVFSGIGLLPADSLVCILLLDHQGSFAAGGPKPQQALSVGESKLANRSELPF